MTNLSCVVIGEDNILLYTLQELAHWGFHILAVFSNTCSVQAYCKQNGIERYSRNASIEKHLQAVHFDFMFSISNPRVLKKSELRLARKMAVNYHDSLLPAYAGVNASSWAIINGESRHGVTLHVIDDDIDTGHILETEEFEVSPDDTAFTLNLKCVKAFQSAFSRLLELIAVSSDLKPRSQDFTQRSYYGLFDCPPNMGILNFNDDFQSVYNVARALDYGFHDNQFGSPKLITPRGHYLVVTKVGAIERKTNTSAQAGTIISVLDSTLAVQTATDQILLSIAELDGSLLHPRKYDMYGIAAGMRLQSIKCQVSESMKAIRRKEGYWNRKMSEYKPTTFLKQQLGGLCKSEDMTDSIITKTIKMNLSSVQLPLLVDSDEYVIIAHFIAFIARVCCSDSIHLGLVSRKTDILPELRPLYSDICPAIFKLDLQHPLSQVIATCQASLEEFWTAGTFLVDMIYRYPQLRDHREELRHNVVISLAEEVDDVSLKHILADCNVILLFTRKEIQIVHNSTLNVDIFHAQILDVVKHFPTFLSSVCSLSPKSTLRDVDLLPFEEKATLFSGSVIEPSTLATDLFSLFEEHCRTQGEAIALKTLDCCMNYKQTLVTVSHLAEMFRCCWPKGVTRCICLHLPNCMAYCLSVLASIKVGLTFLPLPVDAPSERMLFTLEDSNVRVMLTCERVFCGERFQTLFTNYTVLFQTRVSDENLIMVQLESIKNGGCGCVQYKDEILAQCTDMLPAENNYVVSQEAHTKKEDQLGGGICYTMYTSGSTGKPKGVQIHRASVANLARAQIKAFGLQSSDTTAQFASIGFDASVAEIFTSLLSGGTLAVLKENERTGREFLKAIAKLQVNVITLPPSMLTIFSPKDMPSVRKIIAAGEVCTSQIANKWTVDKSVTFFNAYGPTETTVCATIYHYKREDYTGTGNQELSIGQAIDGVQVYLLDGFMKPVPKGIVGEIHIGGAGMSAGYIGHATVMNQSRFISCPVLPFQNESSDSNESTLLHDAKCRFPGKENICETNLCSAPNKTDNELNGLKKSVSTLYKTGDFAYFDHCGGITFLGRLDEQIKIRGQRVDLCEIERVIMQETQVEMGIVVNHTCGMCKEPVIAAFVAPVFIDTFKLREQLSRFLPKYMIPTFIQPINPSDFPVTINGKINRKALERNQSVHTLNISMRSGDLSASQFTLAKLMCKVLDIDESYAQTMGRASTLSHYGGSSLHLIRLQREIEETFHTQLSFVELCTADCMEKIMEAIDRKNSIVPLPNGIGITDACNLKDTLLLDSFLDLSHFDIIKYQTNLLGDKCQCILPPIKASKLNILISGTTGFLGAFLLVEILEKMDAHVICMVRERSQSQGMSRVVQNLKMYHLWKNDYLPRLSIVLSDMSKDRLGLSMNTFDALSHTIDVIFANAAMMNFNTAYSDHRQVNVTSVRELVRMALTGKKKYIFLTSSLSVFLFPQQSHPRLVFKESDTLDDPLLVDGGYGQSKWVSERLVTQALPWLAGGAIFRPARVSGRSTDGAGPKDDLFVRCLAGMRSMGSIPDLHFPYDLTPVDYCAKAIVEVASKCIQVGDDVNKFERKKLRRTNIFHLFNKQTIDFQDLFLGSKVKVLPLDEWRSELKTVEDNQHLLPLTPFFMSSFWDRAVNWPVFGTHNTDKYISHETKQLLKPTGELLEIYKRYLNIND